MKRALLSILFPLCALLTSAQSGTAGLPPSPTEGVITSDFVDEETMQSHLLAMLARFSQYMVQDFYDCQEPNSAGEVCGFFNGESSGQANEAGVRTNADLSMICAFLVRYGQPAGVTLPQGVSWERVQEIAQRSLVFAYSTHKANRLKVCAGRTPYWGSTAPEDHVWESSLWAMSVAYSAYFQWENLSAQQREYIHDMLVAECNYELLRTIPTGYAGDTKAEENGWEACVLAATLGLFPDDPQADRWYARLRQFAINSYSHESDAHDHTVIDPSHDRQTIADLYEGNNLYADYTLQNHNLFHTSYQNVVMQELGEAALALRLFQTGLHGHEKWHTQALMHHNREVMTHVLNWLALADGELAMPNGNDWSLFLYDQITSYSTMACFLRDADALMLENLAYKQIQARQQTTQDGSWLLRPDVGARRMGVEAHRVMMTYLMHEAFPTADLSPTRWEDFRASHSQARILPCQNIVRAYSPHRFTTFSWSQGLRSYTGYFTADCPDRNKIVVPYRAHNTGNITGWYEVEGKGTNATPIISGNYELEGDGYVMNGELDCNDASLNHRFALYSTPGNAIIYLDYVTANADVNISAEKTGLLAISTDELTRTARTLYYQAGGLIDSVMTGGDSLTVYETPWVNIDQQLGILGQEDKVMAFGDRGTNNSIFTSKLYPLYGTTPRSVCQGDVVDSHRLVYYSQVDAEQTRELNERLIPLTTAMPRGWNAVLAADPDGTYYLLACHFAGETDRTVLSSITCPLGAPIFRSETAISADGHSTTIVSATTNHSAFAELHFFVRGADVIAQQDPTSPTRAILTSAQEATCTVSAICNGETISSNIHLPAGQPILISTTDSQIKQALYHP